MEHLNIEGFPVLKVHDEELNCIGNAKIEIVEDFLRKENIELIKWWEEHKKK